MAYLDRSADGRNRAPLDAGPFARNLSAVHSRRKMDHVLYLGFTTTEPDLEDPADWRSPAADYAGSYRRRRISRCLTRWEVHCLCANRREDDSGLHHASRWRRSAAPDEVAIHNSPMVA